MEFKVLLVDDNEDDSYFFIKALNDSGVKADVSKTTDGDAALKRIKSSEFDCIFLDYVLPGMDGLDILKEIRRNGIETPVIMLTGQKDESTIVRLMQEGATDYLSKDSLNPESLRLSIENSQRIYIAKKEKLLAEQALKISEARLSEAQRIAKIGNWEYDYKDRTLFLSNEANRILEFSSDSSPTLLKFFKKVHPDDYHIVKNIAKSLRESSSFDVSLRIIAEDQTIKYINVKGHINYDDNNNKSKILCTIQDISILKNALNDTKKAKIQRKATTVVLGIAIVLFIVSEAIVDPVIDSLTASLLIGLSFKGTIALILKPVESFLEKIMLSRWM
ncbi:MAG TPA: response regulator [Cytophagaceae bacterium]